MGKRRLAGALQVALLLCAVPGIAEQLQESEPGTRPIFTFRSGQYLADRGPFDPHPFARTHVGDGLIFNSDYFNRLDSTMISQDLACLSASRRMHRKARNTEQK